MVHKKNKIKKPSQVYIAADGKSGPKSCAKDV